MTPSRLQPIDVIEVLGDAQYGALKSMLEAYKSLASGSIRPQHAHSLIGTAFVSAMNAYCETGEEPEQYLVPAHRRSQHAVVVKT